MRGETLVNLVRKLKGELGYSLESGVAVQSDARLKVLFSTKQDLYASLYDWPFLKREWNVTLAGGASTFNQPVNAGLEKINWERPVLLEAMYGQLWHKLEMGIGSQEYNVLTEAQDPVQRYDFSADGADGDVIKVWPTPVSETSIRLTGQRRTRPLAADTDVADLDDLLLVFSVAADLAMEAEAKNAQYKLKQSTERLRQVLQTAPTRDDEPLVLGQCSTARDKKRLIPVIVAP